MEPIRAGIGLTGSFCTFKSVFDSLEEMLYNGPGIELTFVLSYHVQQLASRFGTPEETLDRVRLLSQRPPLMTIPEAEPLGPKDLLDIFVIAPCTGNTLAKLAAGITDSSVIKINKCFKSPLSVAFYYTTCPPRFQEKFFKKLFTHSPLSAVAHGNSRVMDWTYLSGDDHAPTGCDLLRLNPIGIAIATKACVLGQLRGNGSVCTVSALSIISSSLPMRAESLG